MRNTFGAVWHCDLFVVGGVLRVLVLIGLEAVAIAVLAILERPTHARVRDPRARPQMLRPVDLLALLVTVRRVPATVVDRLLAAVGALCSQLATNESPTLAFENRRVNTGLLFYFLREHMLEKLNSRKFWDHTPCNTNKIRFKQFFLGDLPKKIVKYTVK